MKAVRLKLIRAIHHARTFLHESIGGVGVERHCRVARPSREQKDTPGYGRNRFAMHVILGAPANLDKPKGVGGAIDYRGQIGTEWATSGLTHELPIRRTCKATFEHHIRRVPNVSHRIVVVDRCGSGGCLCGRRDVDQIHFLLAVGRRRAVVKRYACVDGDLIDRMIKPHVVVVDIVHIPLLGEWKNQSLEAVGGALPIGVGEGGLARRER